MPLAVLGMDSLLLLLYRVCWWPRLTWLEDKRQTEISTTHTRQLPVLWAVVIYGWFWLPVEKTPRATVTLISN